MNAGVASVPPSVNVTPPTDIVEFTSFALVIEPANIAFVIPNALTLNESEFVSIELSSTLTANDKAPDEPPPDKPSPAVTAVMSPNGRNVVPSFVNSHISDVSLYLKNTSALEPLSTCRPAFSEGAPEVPLFSVIILSAKLIVSVLTVVVVPETVKFALNTTSLLKVFAPPMLCVPEVLTTVLSTAKVPELFVIPSPPVRYVAPSTYAFLAASLACAGAPNPLM